MSTYTHTCTHTHKAFWENLPNSVPGFTCCFTFLWTPWRVVLLSLSLIIDFCQAVCGFVWEREVWLRAALTYLLSPLPSGQMSFCLKFLLKRAWPSEVHSTLGLNCGLILKSKFCSLRTRLEEEESIMATCLCPRCYCWKLNRKNSNTKIDGPLTNLWFL